ncbi:unnamed protein product [Sympodiomycopsis kandeliae]
MSGETQQRVGYPLAASRWPAEGTAAIFDQSGQQLLVLSIEFLRKGKVDTFAFILQCIEMAFVTEGGHICDDAAQAQSGAAKVFAGRFVYHCNTPAETPCRPRIGPRFKFKSRPPHAGDDQASTMSNSKRSSANQANFRVSLIGRDFYCLVSDAEYESCTASHILPFSRPEYYAELLGFEPTYLFEPSYGLLLRDDLHHGFDRGHIALWPLMNETNDLVVHILKPEQSQWRQYHGKVLRPQERFRGDPIDHPDVRFLLFHYQQCTIKCFRGWSCF